MVDNYRGSIVDRRQPRWQGRDQATWFWPVVQHAKTSRDGRYMAQITGAPQEPNEGSYSCFLRTSRVDGETKIPDPIMVPTIKATPLTSPTCREQITVIYLFRRKTFGKWGKNPIWQHHRCTQLAFGMNEQSSPPVTGQFDLKTNANLAESWMNVARFQDSGNGLAE